MLKRKREGDVVWVDCYRNNIDVQRDTDIHMVTGVGMNRDINSNNPQNILKYAFFSVKITQWISFH